MRYRFKVGDEFYVGHRVRVGHPWIGSEPVDIRIININQLRPGGKVKAYYDPNDPKKSTLIKGLEPGLYTMWIPLFTLIVLRVVLYRIMIPKLNSLPKKLL